jgi:periplasmic protein TonB
MTAILQHDEDVVIPQSSILAADFLMPQREIETMRQIVKPEKPELQSEPQLALPELALPMQSSTLEVPAFTAPKLQSDLKISLSMPQASADSDYMPLLKVAPLYPQMAARRNLEGYVIVEYIVMRSGEVRDVKVIESRPAGVFDKSAIEAARKFKYRPRKVDGQAVEVPGVQNKFIFRLER